MITALSISPITSGKQARLRLTTFAHTQAFALAALGILSLLVRLPYLGDPAADYDEQLYSLIGQRWLEGQLPYVDLWDRKPPGLFALYAAMHWLGGPSPLVYEIGGLFATFLAAALLYQFTRPLGSHTGALTVSALFLINLPLFLIHLGQSETFLLPILIGEALLFRAAFATANFARARQIMGWAMALGGISLQIKYSVLPFCLLMAGLALYRLVQLRLPPTRVIAVLSWFALLGLLPTFIGAAYFLYHGAFQAYFDANFVSIFERGEMSPSLIEQFRTHLTVASAPLIVYAVLGWREARGTLAVDRVNLHVALAFAGAGLATLVMLGNAFVHYFAPLLPFLLALATPFFSFGKSHRLFIPVSLLLAVYGSDFPEQLQRSASNRSAIPQLTQAIEAYVPKGECLFVFDGPTALYNSTRRCTLSRLVFPDHLINPREKDAVMLDVVQEVGRVAASRPGAIVITSNMVGPTFNPDTVNIVKLAIARDYRMVESSFLYPAHVELFVRRDLLANEQSQGADRPKGMLAL